MSSYEVAPGGVIKKPRICGGEVLHPGTVVSAEDFGGSEFMAPLIAAGHLIKIVGVDSTYNSVGSNQTEAERQAEIQAKHEADLQALRTENEAIKSTLTDPGGVKLTHDAADLQALIADIDGDDNKLALLTAMVVTANEKFEDQSLAFDMPTSIEDAIALLTLDSE